MLAGIPAGRRDIPAGRREADRDCDFSNALDTSLSFTKEKQPLANCASAFMNKIAHIVQQNSDP
jgi:hypothetical protein